MLKLFRDSLFRPKKIIAYRAKPGWFVFLYIFIFSILVAFCASYRTLFYSKTTYGERIEIAYEFSGSDATINDYTYSSSKNHVIILDNTIVLFTPNEDKLNYYLQDNTADFVVSGDSLYHLVVIGARYSIMRICKLSDLSESFKNVNLSTLDTSSDFFSGLDQIISFFRPLMFSFDMIVAFVFNITGWLFIALLSYWFANLFYGAKFYMKKGQLYKMLIFATTSYNIATAFIYVANITGILQFGLIALSLIPLMAFEREILLRIRLFQLSKGMIKDEELAKKLQEMNEDKENKEKDGE